MFALKAKLQIYIFLLLCYPRVSDTLSDDAHNDGRPRPVLPSLDCTFETGICSWRHSSLANELKWGISELIPDHTSGAGYYLRSHNDRLATTLVAHLRGPPVVTSGETCLTFWYYMKTSDVGELSVYKLETQRHLRNRLFSVFGSQGKRWYRAVVPTGSGEFQLEIAGSVNNKYPEEGIGIDDISFRYVKCPEAELENVKNRPRVACDFEEDLCSWFPSYDFDDVKWVTMSTLQFPNDRHPLPPFSSGKSVAGLMRVNDGYNIEMKLQGPTISVDSQEACFSFWYKIQGRMVSFLKARMIEHRYPHESVTLYSSEKLVGPTWIQANITLPRKDNFYIKFEALTIRGHTGVLLLDDINISHGGPCHKENQEDMINCDFDKDFCWWYLTTDKDDNDWARIRGPTPTDFTGPSHDHTTGDGHYVFFDASKLEQANLYSHAISVDSKGACFSFWYYMYGEDIYTLELLWEPGPHAMKMIWSLTDSQENKWIQQNVSLSPSNKERGRLNFIARSVYFPRGDIALDDISITFGAPCESDIPEPTESDYEFKESTDTEVSVTATYIPTPSTPDITELPTPLLILKDGFSTVYENSRVELECQTDTNLTVMTKWYLQKDGKKKMRPDVEQHRKNLVFDEIQQNESGTFACSISFGPDVTSDLSNSVRIKVVDDPRRIPHIYANTYVSVLEVDKTVELRCGNIDIKRAAFHWKTTSPFFTDSSLPNTRILILNGTKPEHSGVYSCRISKDGFMTAKSRALKVTVVPGKFCDYDWECSGHEYKRKCVRNRCKCHKNAATVGPRCLLQPEQPKIVTFPRFLEYGIGESFYVICRAKNPAPPMMRYTFITPKGQFESHSVLKITRATEEDTGYYQCFVTDRNLTSRHSTNIIVQIKEFTNLTCDFHNDFCKWSQRNDSSLSSFEHITSTLNERPSDSNYPGAYIQVPKGDSDLPNKAILVSSTIDRTTLNCCLTFRHQMMGSEIRGLSVWVYKFAERLHGDGGTRLWTVIGDKGKKWMERKITIPPGEDFYIAFEAIGPVAITDIKFTYRGVC